MCNYLLLFCIILFACISKPVETIWKNVFFFLQDEGKKVLEMNL